MEGTLHSVCSIERYEPVKQCWMFVTFFPQPRRRVRCAVACTDQRIYIFGGSDGPNMYSSWDYYDVGYKYWASQVQSQLEEAQVEADMAEADIVHQLEQQQLVGGVEDENQDEDEDDEEHQTAADHAVDSNNAGSMVNNNGSNSNLLQLQVTGMQLSVEQLQSIRALPLNTIPTRPQGLKGTLAVTAYQFKWWGSARLFILVVIDL